MKLQVLALGATLLGMFLASGCARFPENSTNNDGRRLTFSFRLGGPIRADYVYIVGITASNLVNPFANTAPLPVVNYPAANGFVSGQPTHFVRYDPLQSNPLILYRFRDSTLVTWQEVGVPITFEIGGPDGQTISFDITTVDLGGSVTAAALLQTMQVNFLTMNRVSLNDGSGRVFDNLGDNRIPGQLNEFVRIPLNTSRTYQNSDFGFLEPSSATSGEIDVNDPSVDLVDWEIVVRD